MKNLILKIVASVLILSFGIFYMVKFDRDNFKDQDKAVVPVNNLTARK